MVHNAVPTPKAYEHGLSKTEEQMLRRSLFGPTRGAVDSPGMNRLFKSTLELGYPQPALDRSMREAKERGTDIERCSEGLPMGMLMPEADTRPDKFSSSPHHFRVGTPRIRIRSISAESTISLPSTEDDDGTLVDSPPSELPVESAVDGVADPARPNAPNKNWTSHGELPKLNRIEDIEAFLARGAESSNRQQVLCDEPPRSQYESTEREAFKAYYKEPASLFLNYFHILERVSDPSMSELGTKRPSTPAHSPVATATRTDTYSVTIPKREQAPTVIISETKVAEHGRNRNPYFR